MLAQYSDTVLTGLNDVVFSNNGIYKIINLQSNYSWITDVGFPQLPVKILKYILPYNAVVKDVSVTGSSMTSVSGSYLVQPVQEPLTLGSSTQTADTINSAIYNSSNPYPGKQLEIVNDGYEMGYHVISIKFYPVEYLPSLKRINVYTHINFTIEYTGATSSVALPEQISEIRYNMAKKYITGEVQNPSYADNAGGAAKSIVTCSNELKKVQINASIVPSGLKSLSLNNQLVPDYIIITDSASMTSFQALANWKTQKGIVTIIVAVEAIYSQYGGVDNKDKILNYLEYAFSQWGSVYVLLGGDLSIIPSFMMYDSECYDIVPDDYYYSSLGTCTSSSLLVGRLPFSDSTDVSAYTNKLKYYEQLNDPHLGTGQNYVNNTLVMSAFLEDSVHESESYFYDMNGPLFNEYISRMPTAIFSNKWYMFDNYQCTVNTDEYQVPYNCVPGDEPLSSDNALSVLNSGTGSLQGGHGYVQLIIHDDHGDPSGIGTSTHILGQGIYSANIQNLTNGIASDGASYYQIFFSLACNSADFNKEVCFGKTFLNNPSGGGVAYIGNTTLGLIGVEEPGVMAFLQAMYVQNQNHIGSGYMKARNFIDNSCSDADALNLLGDPEMPMWTVTPTPLIVNVSTNPSLVVDSACTITVAIDNSGTNNVVISLIKYVNGSASNIEAFYTKTVSGNAVTPILFTPETPGILLVTVTAPNFNPYIDTIHVVTNQTPQLTIDNYTVQDDTSNGCYGNNDHQIGSGETVGLLITLQNNGGGNATNVNATATCNSSYITMTDSSLSFGNISSDSNKTAQSLLLFKVQKNSPSIPLNSENPVIITLNISSGAYRDTEKFNIQIVSPRMININNRILSGTIAVGKNVTLSADFRNTGDGSTMDVSCILEETEEYEETTQTFMAGEEVPDTFKIRLYSAKPCNIYYVLTDAFGNTWRLPAGGGFLNLSSTDTIRQRVVNERIDFNYNPLYKAIQLLWSSIPGAEYYDVYRCNVDQTTGVETSTYTLLYSGNTLTYTDQGIQSLIKYKYMIGVVPSSLIETLSAPLLAYTNQICNMQLINGSGYGVISCDLNNDGQNELIIQSSDFTIHGSWINVFKSSNDSLLFSKQLKGGNTINSPAIADVNGDGKEEIITVSSWESDTTYPNYIEIFNSAGDELAFYKLPGTEYLREPIVSDINGDGNMEIIVKSIGSGFIEVYQYNKDSNMISPCTFPKSTNPLNFYVPGFWERMAVANLNSNPNGQKEIIAVENISNGADNNGGTIWIFNPDGTPYAAANPAIQDTGYCKQFSYVPIVADFIPGGDLEIAIIKSYVELDSLIVYQFNSSSRTYSKAWRVPLNNYLSACPTASTSYISSKGMAAADINGDGKIDIVIEDWAVYPDTSSFDVIKTNNKGVPVKTKINISSIQPTQDTKTILLANIDNNPDDLEAIISNGNTNTLYGIKLDSTVNMVSGFPIVITTEPSPNSISISDINGDGVNEILETADQYINIWQTNGIKKQEEWDLPRYNFLNTNAIEGVPQLQVDGENLVYSDSIVNVRNYILNLYEDTTNKGIFEYYEAIDTVTSSLISLDNLNITQGVVNIVNVQSFNEDDFTSNYSDPKYLYYSTCYNTIMAFTTNHELKKKPDSTFVDLQKFESSDSIKSEDSIPDGISVIFNSGNHILLQPGFKTGFKTISGSSFQAYIYGCTPLKNLTIANNSEEVPNVPGIDLKDIEIFPNPTTGKVTINIPEPISSMVNIEFYSLSGVLLNHQEFKNTRIVNIDISGYYRGLYLLRIISDDGSHIYKVIKQ